MICTNKMFILEIIKAHTEFHNFQFEIYILILIYVVTACFPTGLIKIC